MRHLLPIIALALAACSQADPRPSILPDDISVLPGDIVFRMGTGVTSAIVVRADGDGEYSHVGIVIDSCGAPYVVHAVPGEPDFPGDSDRVKCDPLATFYGNMRASFGEVCRVADRQAAVQAAAYALDAHRRRVPFDHDYDNADTTRLYCCELVTRAYASAGVQLVATPPHEMSLPGFGDITCTLPSDILHSPMVQRITQF